MTLGNYRHIRYRGLQGAATLLLGNETGNAAVNLIGEKPFGTHGEQTQYIMERIAHRYPCRCGHRRQLRIDPVVNKGFLGNIAQDFMQFNINRDGIVERIMNNETAVAGNLAQDLAVDLLALADGLELFDIFLTDQETVALLILRHVDLKHRHGRVADVHLPDIDAAPGLFNQLFQNIARAAGALIMGHFNQGTVAHFIAGPDDAVHLLFHFRIAALHGIEIEILHIVALQHARCRPAAKADPVGRAADLDNEHVGLFFGLFRVAIIDLADTAGKHDRFQIPPPFVVG